MPRQMMMLRALLSVLPILILIICAQNADIGARRAMRSPCRATRDEIAVMPARRYYEMLRLRHHIVRTCRRYY